MLGKAPQGREAFEIIDGLLVLVECAGATVRGITFRPTPVIPFDEFKARGVPAQQLNALQNTSKTVRTAVAVRARSSPSG